MTPGMLQIYAAKTSVEGLMNYSKFRPNEADSQVMRRMMTMARLMDKTRRPLVFSERAARFEFDMKLLVDRKFVPAGV